MKKLLLILLCLPMIGFGQKREKRKIVDGSRKTHITKGEKKKRKIRRKFSSSSNVKIYSPIIIPVAINIYY